MNIKVQKCKSTEIKVYVQLIYMLKTQQLKDICTSNIHETRKEMHEIKSYCTGLQQTGALCLLQPVQGTIIRLNAKQSSHVLTSNVKYSG